MRNFFSQECIEIIFHQMESGKTDAASRLSPPPIAPLVPALRSVMPPQSLRSRFARPTAEGTVGARTPVSPLSRLMGCRRPLGRLLRASIVILHQPLAWCDGAVLHSRTHFKASCRIIAKSPKLSLTFCDYAARHSCLARHDGERRGGVLRSRTPRRDNQAGIMTPMANMFAHRKKV